MEVPEPPITPENPAKGSQIPSYHPRMEPGAPRPRLQIDADDLAFALQNHHPEMIQYLELETGEIGLYGDGMLNGTEVDEDFDIDEFLADDERYVVIRGVHSSESYEVMEDFIDSLPAGNAKRRLSEATAGRKPFRRFKDTLFDLGDVRDQWFEFEEKAQLNQAQAWLDANKIDAELVTRRSTDVA